MPNYPPISYLALGMLALLLIVMVAFIEIGVIGYAYSKLGISHRAISSLLLLTILGSYVNVPLASIVTQHMIEGGTVYFFGMPDTVPYAVVKGQTEIAVNVGGALIPAILSVYLLMKNGALIKSLLATAIVAVIVHQVAYVVPGVGIAVPSLLPGLVAAVFAWLLERQRTAVVAYVSGSMGCLIGADLWNLHLVSHFSAPVVSIGGAGTFDGVFIAGVLAVLLA